MKKYIKNIFKIGAGHIISAIMLLLWLCSGMALTGCKKDRLFTHVDSTAAVPSQFHFFNSYSYDSALAFSIDGLLRESVKEFSFSQYYPSSSAFNLNSDQPNSKLININDPVIQTQYANVPSNNIFQFKPNVSYVVFSTNTAYDTVSSPLKVNVPTLIYYPEDTYHPFDGTTGIRLFDCIAGSSGPAPASVAITPNVGQGTSLSLNPIYTLAQPVTAASSYTTTQAGIKKITLQTSNNNVLVQLNFLPIQLGDGKNYTLFAVGDIKNFLAGIQPKPRLFLTEDGNPSSLTELTLSSITYPGNLSTQAQVTVINDAYNVPGILSIGNYNANTLIQYTGLDVQFNQTKINVKRWPIWVPPGGGALIEDVNDYNYMLNNSTSFPLNILQRVTANSALAPGAYQVNVLPGSAFSPIYNTFNYSFQQGLAYTVCLLPDNTTSQKCSELVLQNDQSPNNSYFKLRIINIMGGTTQVDVHTGSPSGPVIAAGVAYGQANDYINLPSSLAAKSLYITAAGSTTALFQLGAQNKPISLAFVPGNSGTIYLMGLLPGTPYNGDSGFFGPYVYYNSDAYVSSNSISPSSQLYY